MESLFRFARSEAERSGKNVRIRFGPIESESGNLSAQTDSTNTVEIASTAEDYPVVEWEPNPVEMPGQFKSLANSASFTEGINELVKIESIQLSGLDAQMARINTETDSVVKLQQTTPLTSWSTLCQSFTSFPMGHAIRPAFNSPTSTRKT